MTLDPGSTFVNSKLASLLVQRKRYADALAIVDRFEARGLSKSDLFAGLFLEFYFSENALPHAEELAAAAPERMRNHATANNHLGYLRLRAGKASAALPLFQRAIELEPKESEHHTLLAECHRKLHNWPAALKAADKALELEAENTDALFERACALAQLKRPVEALGVLRTALELDEEAFMSEDLEKEEALKPLARLPGFKRLVEDVKRVEDGESPVAPEQKPAETPVAPQAKKPAQTPAVQPAKKPAEK
jgi:tetratricopeptide (TPR) repeat protein